MTTAQTLNGLQRSNVFFPTCLCCLFFSTFKPVTPVVCERVRGRCRVFGGRDVWKSSSVNRAGRRVDLQGKSSPASCTHDYLCPMATHPPTLTLLSVVSLLSMFVPEVPFCCLPQTVKLTSGFKQCSRPHASFLKANKKRQAVNSA